ncbi:MAG TPA: VPDSG-CTERM sorting domain-containing protein, partial [Chthoniobacterales bacterium]|nr:VPDSG-CTERM sorting domain-containing protein [Chthoniobacterales bacterium]
NPMTVNSRGGDYLGVPPGLLVDFAPISWIGQGNTAVLTSNNNPEWIFEHGGSTYRMSLLSLHQGTLNLAAGTVSLSGTGILFINGAIERDPSPATFDVQGFLHSLSFTVLTAGTCNINCGPPAMLVPESGSAVALLALGVAALVLFRRKSRIAA